VPDHDPFEHQDPVGFGGSLDQAVDEKDAAVAIVSTATRKGLLVGAVELAP
jgi:hypothetical protein